MSRSSRWCLLWPWMIRSTDSTSNCFDRMTLHPAPMFAVSALLLGRLRRLVAAPIVYVLPHAREDTRDGVEMRGYAFIPGPGIEQGLISAVHLRDAECWRYPLEKSSPDRKSTRLNSS